MSDVTPDPQTLVLAEHFPTNIIDLLRTTLQARMPEHRVLGRSLKLTDPSQSIGIYADMRVPELESHEIGQEPESLARWTFGVQNMIQSADEMLGKNSFAAYANIIRVLLYRDPVLHATIPTLTQNLLGYSETVRRWGVGRQQFAANVVGNSQTWAFVAQTEVWVQTQVTALPI